MVTGVSEIKDAVPREFHLQRETCQTCSQVSEVQVQVKSQVFEVKSKSSLKSLKRSPSHVLSL